jgi:hypothetical protein
MIILREIMDRRKGNTATSRRTDLVLFKVEGKTTIKIQILTMTPIITTILLTTILHHTTIHASGRRVLILPGTVLPSMMKSVITMV